MIYLHTQSYTIPVGTDVVVKTKEKAVFNLYISNKSEDLVEVLFDTDTDLVDSGVILSNQTLTFDDNTAPRNQVRVKNLSENEVTVTVIWSE